MFVITLENLGGVLETRTVFFEEEVQAVVLDLVKKTPNFYTGDTIKVVEED